MGRYKHFLLQVSLLLFMISSASGEQTEWTVRGKALEKGTRKPLEGITVYLVERETDSAVSGHDGSFTLIATAPGAFSLVGVGAGYNRSAAVKVSTGGHEEPKSVTLYLEPLYSMAEVVVEADRNPDKTGKTAISGKELTAVAGSAGDPLRGMQALPGITTANDSSSNPAIRGSGPENNVYYADFMPVGYLFHMGGMVSVFNADLVEDFNIYSAAFGPEYLDVTGGVIDVKLRNPRTDRLGGKLNLSTFEADFLIEGPVAENQSFYASARRSYFDLFMPDKGDLDTGVKYRQFPQFSDYQAKYVWNLSPDQVLVFQATGAKDEMKITMTDESKAVQHDPILAGDFNLAISYNAQGLLLASKLSPQVNNRLGVSHMGYLLSESLSQLGHVNVEGNTLYVRDHLNVAAGEDHDVLVGVDYGLGSTKLDLNITTEMPSDWDPDTDFTSSARFTNTDRITSSYWALALKDRWKVLPDLTLVAGGRATYETYFRDSVLEPRLSAEYRVATDTLITAGWGKYHQFPQGHQVIEGMGNPDLDYERAEHCVLGVEQTLGDGWSARVEGYYKYLYDLVVPSPLENYQNGGSGKAYGAELLIKKNPPADWWGWLAVGYSKTERRNDLTGLKFPYAYDQPIIVNIVYTWKFLPKWTFGAKWRYQSGAPITPVIGTYTDTTDPANPRIRPIYGELGTERLPSYHRLDLRIMREFLFDTWKMGAYLEIINAYDHENISGYEYDANYITREPIEQLPIMPGIGIQAEF